MTRIRRQFKPLRRKVGSESPKPKIVIFTEGTKTERDYFEAMRRAYRSAIVDVEIFAEGSVPLTLANKAIEASLDSRRKNRGQSFAIRDEFWVVFDCDEHPNLKQAFSKCKGANVEVAFSNPCFELWLILHFEDFDRPDHRHDVQRHFAKICSDYDRTKRKTTDCDRLMSEVVAAEERAKRQFETRCKESQEGRSKNPPFTTVYKLTDSIRNGGKRKTPTPQT